MFWLKKLKLPRAIKPISIETIQIFIKDLVISFRPKPPIFRLKVIKSNKVPTIAAILVARARPPMSKYLSNTTFRMTLTITAMVAPLFVFACSI